MNHRVKKTFITALKLAFALGALSYVLYKTDVAEITGHIKQSNYSYFLGAFLLLNIAIILSGLRLRIYLAAENLHLNLFSITCIFYVGMFFNTVLPGGIGGDGYIALYLKKKFHFSVTSAIRLLLSARANGLFFCNLYLFFLGWGSGFVEKFPQAKTVIIVLMVLQIPVYFLVTRFILRESFKTFVKAGLFSMVSQVFFILAAYMVYLGIGVEGNMYDYIVMYIASSIAAVLPVSPGGVGIREFIFYKGSHLLGLDAEQAIAASLIYFAVYVTVSLAGLVFYITSNKIPHHKEQ